MCKVLTELCGRLPVAEFGPKTLKQVRAKMLGLDWSRTFTNKQVNRLKRMFKWAVAEELCPPSVLHGLQAVGAIRRGEPNVRETEPVRPVPDAWIEAAVPLMNRQVAALVRLQVLTGARPGGDGTGPRTGHRPIRPGVGVPAGTPQGPAPRARPRGVHRPEGPGGAHTKSG